MRRETLPLLSLVALLVGCGGGESAGVSNPPPSPPPVQVGPPSVVRIQSGNDQQGEPGQKLPVRPAVTVRDAADRAVPNVAVSFAVDSGGGTIAAAAVLTDASGVATAGEWTLGSSEGRHTLLVSAASLSPVRFGATAVFAPVVVGTRTVGASGGTITVDRVGSPVHGLEVQVPDSAVTQGATLAIGIRSSAGVILDDPAASQARATLTARAALVAPAPALLPLITLQVTGPQWANVPVSIVIPLPVGVSPNVLVAILDSTNNPLTFLPLVASTPTTVTVTTRAFDWHVFAAVGSPPVTSNASTYTLTLAIFSIPSTKLNQGSWLGTFVVGTNTFDFRDVPTAIAPRIDVGMVLAAHGALWMYPGGIANSNHRATPSAPLSNTRGIMLSAGLTNDFFRHFGARGAAQIAAYHAVSPASYSYGVALAVYYQLANTGYPVPLVLTDGVHLRMVLVVDWNSAGSYFGVYDPAYSSVVKLGWTNTGITPYTDPHDPTIRYTMLYTHPDLSSALWPRTYAGLAQIGAPLSQPEPYSNNWPVSLTSSWDPILRGSPRWEKPDTLFVVGDTTRLWYSMPNARLVYPTTLPLPTGHGLQEAMVYQWDKAGQRWLPNLALSGRSTFIDTRVAGQGGQSYEAQFGINLQQVEGAQLPSSWLYFDRLDVVKYAATISATQTAPLSARFTVQQPGGPRFPTDARYQWDFGDGSAPINAASPGTATHTFPGGKGPFQVTLTVLHAATNSVKLARVQMSYSTEPRWKITSFVQSNFINTLLGPPLSGPTLAGLEKEYRWTEAELRDSLLSRPGGGIIQVFAPGKAPQAVWKHPNDDPYLFDWLLALREAPGSPSMYVTFQRGASLMAGVLGATGVPTIVPPFGIGVPRNPTTFANQFAQSATTPTTYTGMAAAKAIGNRTSNSALPSLVILSLEIAATVTPSGLSGTITFVTAVACVEDDALRNAPGCSSNGLAGELRRVFSFTAVPF